MNTPIRAIRPRGFSIVEIMVAMVIALLGMLVIFQVFAIAESYNRTAINGSDAQQNGAYALYVLQQEMREAGWGFNNSQALGCNVLAYNSTLGGPPAALTPGAPPGTYTLAPVLITAALTTTGSDTLEVNYGNQNLLVAPVAITFQSTPLQPFVVANPYGFNQGDVFLAVQPGLSCTLVQMTNAFTAAPVAPCGSSSNCVQHNASATAYPYNNPAGSGVTYTSNGYLFNLGSLKSPPTRDVFSVVNNQLTVVASLTSAAQQVVADNIVQLKAQYGHDNGLNNGTVPTGPYVAGDGIVDSYDTVTPATATAWNQLLTVRIGLVARSAQPEKPSGPGPACDTTITAPTWSGGNFDLSANANWMCYRYKVFETVIPVKNILWTQG
jgi:type IV pilus assembly protein PilW